ncbi:MAG: glycoside hydrolase family 2 TIM barrel-domain containing protein [Bacteroidales bacterium]
MNKVNRIGISVMVVLSSFTGCSINQDDSTSLFSGPAGPKGKILLDAGWRFYLGDLTGAEDPQIDDGSWRSLDLPHDWSIEDIPGSGSPLDPEAVGGINTGYFRGGTGWYRKTFDLPADLKGSRLSILFEGVYMDATVWINGSLLGNHPYGYTSFWYDITDQLVFGEENCIAVKVRNEGRNSRWYSGSGIYRHVWLTVTEPVHIPHWGTSVTTPLTGEDTATVLVINEIVNQGEKAESLTVKTSIVNPGGIEEAFREDKVEIAAGAAIQLSQQIGITSPGLWSPESPSLYRAITSVEGGKSRLLDRVETPFGIRSITLSQEGFFLNGENVILKGGCMHHDNGPLGAAAYDRAEERRVELMKASGFNSIRCAHNPPSTAFLEACDRIGMLVIDEAFDMWRRPKNEQDYHRFFDESWESDVASMVKRDRNHPSVIMWSIGNEIPERAEPEGVETAKMLAQFVRELDPTRPVTSAVNGLNPDKDPYFSVLDVSGYNYAFGGDHGRKSVFETDHERVPGRIMYNAESYPLTAFGAWMDVLDHPYVIGDFVWTGFDYLGEASIGWLGYPHEGSFYPWNHAFCGDIDICGIKRPQSYYRNVLWGSGEQLSIFVKPPVPSFPENPDRIHWSKWHWQDVVDCWNWPGHESKPLDVEVYSAYDRVELFLNNESLGIRTTNRETEWIGRWSVPYQPGTLKAFAYRGSQVADSCVLTTESAPSKITMVADRSEIQAGGQDLSYISVEIVDRSGMRNSTAENLIHFELEGEGTIQAVANSNPMSAESYQQPYRKAFRGRCLVVVKSGRYPGEITLTATSEGLDPATIQLVTN